MSLAILQSLSPLELGPHQCSFSFLLEPDSQLQLDSQLCLLGKKKFTGRGITGFQVFLLPLLGFLGQMNCFGFFPIYFVIFYISFFFCGQLIIFYLFQFLPQDCNRVMVTCADSQVRILDGLNVIGKYKSMFLV